MTYSIGMNGKLFKLIKLWRIISFLTGSVGEISNFNPSHHTMTNAIHRIQ